MYTSYKRLVVKRDKTELASTPFCWPYIYNIYIIEPIITKTLNVHYIIIFDEAL